MMRTRAHAGIGFTLCTLSLFACIHSGASPGPAGENLFPIGKGSSWTFKGTAMGTPIEMTATVTSSVASGGTTAVKMNWTTNGRSTQEETYLVSADSIQRARAGANGSSEVSPPVTVIKYPVSVGKSWSWAGKMKVQRPQGGLEVPASATVKIAARENIKTPAGTFSAYRVDLSLSVEAAGKTQVIPNSYWFAPGVGLVRQRMSLHGQNGQAVVIEASVTKYSIK